MRRPAVQRRAEDEHEVGLAEQPLGQGRSEAADDPERARVAGEEPVGGRGRPEERAAGVGQPHESLAGVESAAAGDDHGSLRLAEGALEPIEILRIWKQWSRRRRQERRHCLGRSSLHLDRQVQHDGAPFVSGSGEGRDRVRGAAQPHRDRAHALRDRHLVEGLVAVRRLCRQHHERRPRPHRLGERGERVGEPGPLVNGRHAHRPGDARVPVGHRHRAGLVAGAVVGDAGRHQGVRELKVPTADEAERVSCPERRGGPGDGLRDRRHAAWRVTRIGSFGWSRKSWVSGGLPGRSSSRSNRRGDRGGRERRLDQREVVPEAHLRPVAEGEVGVGRDLLPALRAEAAGVEALGVGEVALVVLGEPGAEDEPGAGRDEVVAELEVGPGPAIDHVPHGVEAHRLLDHLTGQRDLPVELGGRGEAVADRFHDLGPQRAGHVGVEREQGESEGEGVGGRRVPRVDQSHRLVAHRAVVELGLFPVDGLHEHPEDVLRLSLRLTRGDHPVDELVEGGECGLEVGIRAGSPRRVDGAPGEGVVPRLVEVLDRLDRPREVAREHRLGQDRERQLRHLRLEVDRVPVVPLGELSCHLAGEDVAEPPDVAVGERPLEQHAAGAPGRLSSSRSAHCRFRRSPRSPRSAAPRRSCRTGA